MIRLRLEQRRLVVERGERAGVWDISPPPDLLTSPHGPIVFIVHGYNNDQEEAEASYRVLRKNLCEILGENQARLDHIWELYWPGYLPKGALLPWRKWPGNLLSAGSYPYQERKAADIGRALAKYIGKIPPGENDTRPEVVFIAHSLGCRVVMETIRSLTEADDRRALPVRVLGVCLMAAAVPASMVEPGGALRKAAESSGKVFILYSPADWVLHFAFPAGQFTAHLSSFPEAVGRFGNPFHGIFALLENVVNTGLGHGDYYDGRPVGDSGPSRTRTTVARLFGRPHPNLLKDHYIVDWPALPESPRPLENDLIENKLS